MKRFAGPSRLSLRILFSFLFAIALIGMAATPLRGAAQQAAKASQSSSSGAAAVEKAYGKQGATETESADDNVYRHTPMVQSIARAFHLDVETTARLFEYLNFAIVALAILVPLVRIMPKVMRRRSETLKQELESARKTTADAHTRLKAIEEKLSGLDREISAMRLQVDDESKQDEVRIKASIEEESRRIVTAAEQEITVAAAQARRELRHFAADLAIQQAAKQLVLTPETDRSLIAEFVKDAAAGGKN